MTVQEYNDLYKRPMVKNVKIVSSGGVTITNTNIVSEQMSLEKSLCSESNLRFGRCEAACFKVRIADIDHDFTGEWLNVAQDAKADIEGYLLTQDGKYLYTEDGQRIQIEYKRDIEDLAQLGHFKVYSDKPDNDRRWKNLTCYDRMYDILNADVAAWYNELSFPMTIKAFRDSFFNYIGVTQKTTTLVNDNFVTQGGFSVTGSLSGKTVIEAICELNGVFGVMVPDDEFDYVSLANPDTLTLDYYVDGTGSYEDYVTDVITGICAKGSESDIGTSVGTTENVYTIVNNPLINGTEGTAALTTALNNLLQNILSISFRPFQVTTYGNPMLPLGTRITINTRNQTIISYVINKEMTGVQGLRDKISAKSDKHQSENINSSYDEIYRTKGKVHELKIDVDGLVSRMATTESKLDNDYYTKSQTESKISQTESEIMTTVSNSYVTQASYDSEIQNLQDQIDGRIEYFDGNVVPTLNNPPANSWTTTAAKDSHIGDLYRYHHGTPEVTDYYRFDKDTSTTPATYSWVVLGESQVDEALRQAELANQKADAAQQQLDALQSDVEDNYYTKSATDSKIQQTANSITQSVSSTYETKSDSTSKFNTADANAQGYANTALATANTNAQGYANSAKDAANAATDNKLTSYYTKTQTDSQIAQTANSITSSVSSTYETKSDATAKLNTANNNAQTYANNARDSANASTDSKLQSYYTKNETDSQIQQTASSITSSVSSTYTTKTEFNNLEVGGRNLFLSTGTAKSITINDLSGRTYGVADYYDAIDTTNNLFKENDEITISFDWTANKSSGTLTVEAAVGSPYNWGTLVQAIGTRNSSSNAIDLSATNKSGHVEIIYKVSAAVVAASTLKTLRIREDGASGVLVTLRNAKLERGNKATDWSPAPEDMKNYTDSVGASTLSTANSNAQGYANTAQTAAISAANAATDNKLQSYYTKTETNSQIQQTASSITQTVSETYTTKEEFNDLQISGRNVLLKTATPVTGTNLTDGANVQFGNDPYKYFKTLSNWGLAVGDTVMCSFDWESNSVKGTLKCGFDVAPWEVFGLLEFSSTNTGSGHCEFKATVASNWLTSTATRFRIRTDYVTQGCYITLSNIKVEIANKATAWSPAPEDAETRITAAESSITQLSNKIVMKVDGNGNIVQVALSADPSTGTAFTVSANNIDFIANGNIQLTSGTIGIYSTNFQVTSDGTVTAKAGQIGGWKITSTQFYDAVADEAGTTQGAGISKYGEGYAFWAGASFANRNNAPLLIGHNGTLRASNAIISGQITSNNLTATGGTIGGFEIDSTFGLTMKSSRNNTYSGIRGTSDSLWTIFAKAPSLTQLNSATFRVGYDGVTFCPTLCVTNDSGNSVEISDKSLVRLDSSETYGGMLRTYNTTGGGILYSTASRALFVHGDFTALGTKSRTVQTSDYGMRSLYCYETPSPMFGDVGEGKIAEDGKCYVWLDSTFSETIKTDSYQVFLQKYGKGECYVTERTKRYFVVEGTEGMPFGWEIKAKQADYENLRLENFQEDELFIHSLDYGEKAIEHIINLNDEREVA